MALDIESFRLKSAASHTTPMKPSRVKRKMVRMIEGAFVAAMPLPWIQQAAQLPGKSLHLALAIRYLWGVHKEAPFPLSYKVAADFGIGRLATYIALTNLESAGLIAVQRGTGKSPVIVVLLTSHSHNSPHSVEEELAHGT